MYVDTKIHHKLINRNNMVYVLVTLPAFAFAGLAFFAETD